MLQGIEWIDDTLVVYSLGNLIFDQDFHDTFDSGFIRLVVDDSGLTQVRFIPLVVDGYRPVPVTGARAERVMADEVSS